MSSLIGKGVTFIAFLSLSLGLILGVVYTYPNLEGAPFLGCGLNRLGRRNVDTDILLKNQSATDRAEGPHSTVNFTAMHHTDATSNVGGKDPSPEEDIDKFLGFSSDDGTQHSYGVEEGKLQLRTERMAVLLRLWETIHHLQPSNESALSPNVTHFKMSMVPQAPHVINCKSQVASNQKLDTRHKNGKRPAWKLWRGQLATTPGGHIGDSEVGEEELGHNISLVSGPYPPWVEGADEDNLAMTRRAQRDLWLHQHPRNCSDPDLKFFVTDWISNPKLGLGARMTWISGILAIALKEKRILVLKSFSRANHQGCVGSARSSWSCYFLPETSPECRARALELETQKDAWENGIISDTKSFHSNLDPWYAESPKNWGEPWKEMHPTTEIGGKLLVHHKATDKRWWRAQAMKYLMRFPSEYMCSLMNQARHHAFGEQAALTVLNTLPTDWPQTAGTSEHGEAPVGEMESYVWDSYKPWVPRPLVGIHVRLGDKAKEMKLVTFDVYMQLAQRLRRRFPDATNVWISSEMKDVIDSTKGYGGWHFHYTNIKRQTGTTSMKDYEDSLGIEASTNNAFVNLLMAADADFFIGALGSTWCTIIDSLRCTGGKEMNGYLSVNKDRHW